VPTEAGFDGRLPIAQVARIGLDISENAPDIGRLLRGHAAVLVEIERLVRHVGALASMRCASESSTAPMDIISIVKPRGGAAGTIIMVATRRKEANDNPSIISSSVMTS
jgi:hypothetical protein